MRAAPCPLRCVRRLEFSRTASAIVRIEIRNETRLLAHGETLDPVEWDQGDTLLQSAVLEELLPDLVRLDDDIVKPPSSGDLQRSRGVVIDLVKRNERSDETLDFAPVKVGMGRSVFEVDVAQTRLY